MELFYYRATQGNVGDDLNAYLWPKVFGDQFFSHSSGVRFIGIGSVFDDRHPKPPDEKRHIVFGAGIRGKRTAPSDYSHFDIKFVRGPLTANIISNDAKYISDPAIISPIFLPRPEVTAVTGRVGFVPYFQTDPELQSSLAAKFGLYTIPTSLEPKDFIEELCSCDYVVCEAMHGAILADAYRIPWKAVRLSSGVLEGRTSLFKWQDWMASLSLSAPITEAVPHAVLHLPRRFRRFVLGYAEAQAAQVLQRALGSGEAWTLSDDRKLSLAQERILVEVDRLKRDAA